MTGKLVTVVLMLIAILAAGCGNKGDLVLPDAEGSTVESPTAQSGSRY